MNIIYHRNLYVPILQLLDLPSINLMVKITSLKILFNIFAGKINSQFLTAQININVPNFSLRKPLLFRIKIYRAKYLERNIINNAMFIYNDLIFSEFSPNDHLFTLDLNYHSWSTFLSVLLRSDM